MASSINTRISFRTDTLENWNQQNPVLLKNELVVVNCGTSTRFKVGDGTTKFKQLKFVDEDYIKTKLVEATSLKVGTATAGTFSVAAGMQVSAVGQYSAVFGYNSKALSNQSFVWNGDDTYQAAAYQDHGAGSFNINPRNGLSGMYVGQQSFASILGTQEKKIDNKIWVGNGTSASAVADLSIQKISQSAYHDLVASNKAISNVIYVVSSDNLNMYDQKIVNLAAGTSDKDAVNVSQVKLSVGNALSTLELSSGALQGIISNSISSLSSKMISGDTKLQKKIDSKIFIDNLSGSVVSAGTLSILNISRDAYHELVANNQASPNALYVVSSDDMSMYDQKIVDLADGTSDSDAINVGQVKLSTGNILDKLNTSTSNLCAGISSTNSSIQTVKSTVLNTIQTSAQILRNEISAGDSALRTAVNSKIFIDNLSGNVVSAESLSILHISRDAYHQLVLNNQTLSNTVYIVSGENRNMYDQKITNLKNGTDAQDAATYGQLTSVQQDLSSSVTQKFADNAIEVENGRHYTLVTAFPVSSTTSSLTYSIADRTVTTISISSSSKDVIVNLPPALSSNGARDFILRVEMSASTVPGFTFVGAGNEDIVFDADSSDWCVLEQGLNLISFTETRRN